MSEFSAEDLYRRLGRLIEEAPPFGGVAPLTTDQLTWIGRAEALVERGGDIGAKAEFGAAKLSLALPSTRAMGHQTMMMAIHKVLAAAELASPAGAQGAFIPVGSPFDAYSAVAKIFAAAASDILVVDPYMDDTMLLDFAGAVSDHVALRLLSDQQSAKASLGPAAAKWWTQYPHRKIQVRLAAARTLHDRAILVDGKGAWTVTQSFKDLAKRSPAEIVRGDDIAALKVAAYEQIWNSAEVVI
ncbi:phosphatidylserine/phosphatidylglycerophosphate/cardiolipin synthase family protein [Bradyrhizobium sp. 147]|uniref:phosphatidylserine/phosphatidylglycerophosphate/ cardiolipin synthase family protein n=1 Tax=Bradyrhizobium sp. 147 TaxID=2782623 RepID=UPI001FFB87C4|nr:phosphatidylserine/phosphatidylglycerophosphate/cardiolipin synthase family protein [Bradyrhizobium sp. 147]MCK1681760.1 phosphatidylserine/phosphatidylglycerophosphate/cardiolipin synthase family protein [Bradyrhizobium sp. 147]